MNYPRVKRAGMARGDGFILMGGLQESLKGAFNAERNLVFAAAI